MGRERKRREYEEGKERRIGKEDRSEEEKSIVNSRYNNIISICMYNNRTHLTSTPARNRSTTRTDTNTNHTPQPSTPIKHAGWNCWR